MNANPILLQIKYARVVEKFADKCGISLDKALEIFYKSYLYLMMSKGIADMHCRSDEYLVEELIDELSRILFIL